MTKLRWRSARLRKCGVLGDRRSGGMRGLVAGLALALISSSCAWAQEAAKPQYDLLPVPAVTIYPGETIRRDMIKELHFLPNTRSRFPVVDSPHQLLGKVAKRTLVADRLIPTNSITEKELITRGSLATAHYRKGPLAMTASVVALEAGTLGQAIRVRNVDSGQVIVGVVEADGSVRVGG